MGHVEIVKSLWYLRVGKQEVQRVYYNSENSLAAVGKNHKSPRGQLSPQQSWSQETCPPLILKPDYTYFGRYSVYLFIHVLEETTLWGFPSVCFHHSFCYI